MIEVKRALLSVSDKTNLVPFAKRLQAKNIEILSTGGTLRALTECGVRARAIEDFTGFPEIMDGRVKTLHPKIHGGLLALRDRPEHVEAMRANDIQGIDLLVVNLYPFAATIARPNVSFEEAIENIDIGGPAMLRAAAKNHGFTAVVCDPADYDLIAGTIESEGGLPSELRLELSRKVFNHTAAYDAMIAAYLNDRAGIKLPDQLTLTYRKVQDLRYGENPHQNAAFYRNRLDLEKEALSGRPAIVQLQGKELSFNNLLDAGAALRTVHSLPRDGAVIIKHLNPCGVAVVRDQSPEALDDAFRRARACDPVSAFGGIIAVQSELDEKTARSIAENFAEVIVAPSFSAGALAVFAEKKNLRLLCVPDPEAFLKDVHEIRAVPGGVLYQEFDASVADRATWQYPTRLKPDEATQQALDFAWRVCKCVKSNAIVFASGDATLGIGAGQMSRIDSVEIAASKAKKAGLELKGSVAASDAFFPFRDGLDAIAAAGARAVIQPGGSVRDEEVIAAADEQGIAMVFTGMRHFLH